MHNEIGSNKFRVLNPPGDQLVPRSEIIRWDSMPIIRYDLEKELGEIYRMKYTYRIKIFFAKLLNKLKKIF